MFWKRARARGSGAAARTSISITNRLTVTYTIITFALLWVTISALYYALLKSLEEEDAAFLTEKAGRLSRILESDRPDRDLLEREIRKGSELQFIRYHIHILDSRGGVIAETQEESGPGDLHALFSEGQHDWRPGRHLTRTKTPDGNSYLVLAASAGAAGAYRIEAALDVTREAGIVRRYRYTAEGILLASILISAAVGAALARRAMRPLARITLVVQRITAARLGSRVHPEQWPRELTALATAFDGMLDRLQDSFSRLSHYSADLAHELRTPINNLIGEAEVMLAKPRDPLEYQQNIESSLEEFIRLRHMIDSLLFLAKAEGTDIRLQLSELDVVEEAQEITGYFEELFQEKKIKLAIGGFARITADQGLLRRALSNVVSNALRYTPEGGSVSICVSQEPGGAARIAVCDTGIGIQPEDIPKIFNRFFRAELARTLDAAGSGLGLALVKSIMDLHGGTIEIQSAPGRGTTINLQLPVAPPEKQF